MLPGLRFYLGGSGAVLDIDTVKSYQAIVAHRG
jgi:hypothetical protein